MKKRLTALLCALIMAASAIPSAAALAGESTRAADTLATLQIVRGFSEDRFVPHEKATRAQAAVLLVRFAGCEKAAAADPWFAGFRDLPAWAADSIDYAVHQEWITRGSLLDFYPGAQITAPEFCTALLRLLGYRDAEGDFLPEEAHLFARRIGLLTHSFDGPLTRGDLFEILRDALTFSPKGDQATPVEHLVSSGLVPRSAAAALGLLDETLTARQITDRRSAAALLLRCFDRQSAIDADEPTSNASAFLISADGLAVTNFHSIEDAIYGEATAVSGEAYPIEKVIWYDAASDMAVIRISMTSTDRKTTSAFSFLELAGTADLRVGDKVYAMGNPLGLGLSVTEGIISAVGHKVERYAQPCIVNTADISRGSSGGALMNVYGQAVAITSGAYSYGNSMYLAVPIDPVLTLDLTGEGITLKQLSELDVHSK